MTEPRMLVLREDAGAIAIRRGVNNPPAANGNGSQPPDAPRWQRIDLTDDRYATPPTPPDLHPLIYTGLRHALSGPPEATKTLLAYHILLDIVRGGRNVAIVDFEMGANRARILLDDLGATRDDLSRIHYHQDVEGPPTDDDLAELAHVALVLIDSSVGAFDASGLDDNSRKDVEAWAKAWIRPLFTQGIATLVLDHVTKNADTRGKFTIGSERKTGGVDVHLGAEPVGALRRGGSAIVKLRTHKDRGAFLERPHACIAELSSHPDTHAITVTLKSADSTDEDGHFKPTIYMEKVSRELERHPGEQRSQKQIEDAVPGRAVLVRQALEELVADGHLTLEIGPRNAKLYTLKNAFRKPSDDLVPTSSHLVPDEVVPPRPTSSPPYRGTSVARDEDDDTTSSRPDEYDQAFIDGLPIDLLEQQASAHTDPTDT